MKETVVVFKKDAHANGFNVSRMRMFGFEADGEFYGRELGMEELCSHEEDPGSKGWSFLLWSVTSVERHGSKMVWPRGWSKWSKMRASRIPWWR